MEGDAVVDTTPAAADAPVDAVVDTAAPVEAAVDAPASGEESSGVEPGESGMTPEQEDAAIIEQAKKWQKAESTDTTGEPQRGPDGKFLKKEGDAKTADPKPVEAKPAVVKPADAKPTEAKPAEAKPATAKTDSAPVAAGAMFDVKALMAEVDAEINAREYDDVLGDDGKPQKTTGAKAFQEYGQISDPLRDRQNLAIEKLMARIEQMVRPALDVAQARQAETVQSDIQATMAAVVAAGVPNAAELLKDPRLQEFANENPQYAGMLVADPDRAADIAFVMNRFSEKYGIAKPAAAAKTRTAPAAQPRSREVQAALASARGGSGAAEAGGTDAGLSEDEKIVAMAQRMQREEAERRRMTE